MKDYLHEYLEDTGNKLGFKMKGESTMVFKLREIRELAGLTRKELSEKSGVHIQTITFLEEGINNVANAKLSTLLALCKALGTKLVNLYPNEKYIA